MKRLMKRFHYGEKGFTLIELLIVIAILGVLAAVIIPNVSRFTESGELAAAKQELESVQTAVDATMAEKGWTTTDGTDWVGGDAPTVAASWDIGDGASTDTADVGGFLRRDASGNFLPGPDGLITAAYYPVTANTVVTDALAIADGATWKYTTAGGWVKL